MDLVNLEVLNSAYCWTISADGELFGLVAGDMGYEPTGIKLDDVSLEIWRLGMQSWEQQNAKKEMSVERHENGNTPINLKKGAAS